jgi:hypothetical protein
MNKKICVYEFMMPDCDDPDIYAAGPIWTWQKTAEGQWIMEHSLEVPEYNISVDHNSVCYRVKIIANLTEHDELFFKLKWP